MTRTSFKTTICFLSLAALLCTVSCKKDNQPTTVAQKVNSYMKSTMEEVYLWEDHIPQGLDPMSDADPVDFFEKLCYRTEDGWSYITPDIATELEETEGVETTFGYALAWGSFSNTNNMFAIVRFVYPDTPAAEAGIKRGDIFVKMNNNDITRDNYMDLYNSPTALLTFGHVLEDGIHTGSSVSLTARKQTLNPVVEWNVLEEGAHKAGYLCFTDFTSAAIEPLETALSAFKDAGVQDVVLDLRYNPGGLLTTASQLIGSLCPASCLDGNTLLISKIWNDLYMDYWNKENRKDQLYSYFPKADEIRTNLNLSRLYVITGDWTASASELLICGLDPYMEVITIGSPTRGKYTAASYFIPDEADIADWGACIILYKYANKLGVTDFKNGFIPDVSVEDVLFGNVMELGNPQELCLAEALKAIGFPSADTDRATAAKATPTGYTLHRLEMPAKAHNGQLIDIL